MNVAPLFAALLGAAAADPLATLGALIADGELLAARVGAWERQRAALDAEENALDERDRDLKQAAHQANMDAASYNADARQLAADVNAHNAACRSVADAATAAGCDARAAQLAREEERLDAEARRIDAAQRALPGNLATLRSDLDAWNDKNYAADYEANELRYETGEWGSRLNRVLTTPSFATRAKNVPACSGEGLLTYSNEDWAATLARLRACYASLSP